MGQSIDHIISRVISGEGSSSEILSLCEWLNESAAHREEFARLKEYWDAEVAYTRKTLPAITWEKVRASIGRQARREARRRRLGIALSIAAAIAILFTLSLSIYRFGLREATTFYTLLTNESPSDFTLSDGTTVKLNRNSQLIYSNFFGKDGRDVRLVGEAFFKVAKDPSKPFVVNLNGADITVLGTEFNAKAEAGSDKITATLVKGSIQFNGASQKIVMMPEQQLTFDRSTNQITVTKTDPDIDTAWKDGVIRYKSIPFPDLVKELEETYQVAIRIDDETLRQQDITVSGTFDRKQDIPQILRVISRSLPIQWVYQDDTYYIQSYNRSNNQPMK